MLIREDRRIFIFCSVLGLLVVSESYIFVPPEHTGNEFNFTLVDRNGIPTTNGTGLLLARDFTNNGTQGTVCDYYDWFSDIAANVICKNMGHHCAKYWSTGLSSSDFNAGIDKVICTDSRSSFTKCRYNTIGQNNTCKDKHIHLRCGRVKEDCGFTFQLVDMSGIPLTSNSGLLLATQAGKDKSGTVCDDHFDEEAALIICRSLKYDCAASWDKRTNWKMQDNYDIVLDDVTCRVKDDQSFSESCTWRTESDCSHKEDIHLTCGCLTDEYDFDTLDKNGKVNNVGGLLRAKKKGTSTEDIVMTVCDDGFTESTANTICKSMNFDCSISWESAGENRVKNWGDEKKVYDIGLTHVDCQEDSTGKTQCYYSVDPYCDHSEDVFLYCGYEHGAECSMPSTTTN